MTRRDAGSLKINMTDSKPAVPIEPQNEVGLHQYFKILKLRKVQLPKWQFRQLFYLQRTYLIVVSSSPQAQI